ncbi:hypothetical protein [Rhodocyclus tenuis]|uniref:hypothetical protein n=1 Tax=Rhodocyclus tenuis TaxID=1066 RepID=UPI001905B501|nr:hypothetical protein [Rhodocyclus tenuis]MBK1679754.1 hypothetical protein [Rhodocyclus tenuis]
MSHREDIKTIAQATEKLRELPALYERLQAGASKADTVDGVLAAFDHVRVFLDQEPPRNWEAETALKDAYLRGQEILKQAFNDYIQSLQRAR